MIAAGIEASRPAGSATVNIYWATDTKKLWAWDGAAWQDCKILAPGPGGLTVEGYRTTPANGTATNPERVNNGVVNSPAAFSLNEYAEIALPPCSRVNRFKFHGGLPSSEDGTWKLQ
ncbi:unnamed protein product, partial [marine sediment metagenome]